MIRLISRFLMLGGVSLFALTGYPLRALDVWLNQVSGPVSLVGEQVTWEATTAPEDPGIYYQFSVASPGAPFSVLRDFNRGANRVDWAPMREGWYTIRVVARDRTSGESASAEAPFEVSSRIQADKQPVISGTGHPLVFLYSAPACQSAYMTVHFSKADDPERRFSTPVRPCNRIKSENFWIAGLEPNTEYRIRHVLWDDYGEPATQGPELTFKTGTVTTPLRSGTAIKWDGDRMNFDQGILLESQIGMAGPSRSAISVARNLEGTVVWYYDAQAHGKLQNMLRPLPGGDLIVVPSKDIPGGLREIDLAGNLIWETNAEAVSERLQALGYPPISQFHHDALRMPGGNILALATSDRVIPGSDPEAPPRHMIGDVLVLMDRNFQVLWVWDSFQKLDVNRRATLGETYQPAPGSTDPPAEDWTHGNAVEYLPDGNLLYSARAQDWLFKIDFRDGAGTGDIIWRLGKDGDFTLDSADAYPWFSHQHDPHFDGTRLWVFDNGNTRYEANGETGNSRGQVYVLDEQNKTARLELNADLGCYSAALGSAERLSNGDYHFTCGILLDGSYVYSQSLEVSPDSPAGTLRYGYQVDSPVYRSFRMHDLYRPGQ